MIRLRIVAATVLVAALPSGVFAGQTRPPILGAASAGSPHSTQDGGRALPRHTAPCHSDPKTGRSVIVRITDRGPFGRGRVLDLCTDVARALGMIDRGVILVRADVL